MDSILYENYLNIPKAGTGTCSWMHRTDRNCLYSGKSTSDSWRTSRFCRNGTQWKYYQEC